MSEYEKPNIEDYTFATSEEAEISPISEATRLIGWVAGQVFTAQNANWLHNRIMNGIGYLLQKSEYLNDTGEATKKGEKFNVKPRQKEYIGRLSGFAPGNVLTLINRKYVLSVQDDGYFSLREYINGVNIVEDAAIASSLIASASICDTHAVFGYIRANPGVHSLMIIELITGELASVNASVGSGNILGVDYKTFNGIREVAFTNLNRVNLLRGNTLTWLSLPVAYGHPQKTAQDKNSIYFACLAGTNRFTIGKIDKETMTLLWSEHYNYADDIHPSGICVDKDALYCFTTSDAPESRCVTINFSMTPPFESVDSGYNISAHSKADGRPLWQSKIGTSIKNIQSNGKFLYAFYDSGACIKIDKSTGKPLDFVKATDDTYGVTASFGYTDGTKVCMPCDYTQSFATAITKALFDDNFDYYIDDSNELTTW